MVCLIVGLGNPGLKYINTRHNVGFVALDRLAEKYKANFQMNSKFFSYLGKFSYANRDIFLLKPQTYMNLSGKAVQTIASFYKIMPNKVIVIHDELDFKPGVLKLKYAGGNNGHNGLKDIDRVIGRDYWRVRLGIGRPIHNGENDISNYVLGVPPLDDEILINAAIDNFLNYFDLILDDRFNEVMRKIH